MARRDYPPSPWMTKSEAAHYLGVSVHTIERMLRRGDLTKYYRGGVMAVRISREEVDGLMVPASQSTIAPKMPPSPETRGKKQ